MFDISVLQYSSENPTLTAILFTVLFAFVLGVMIVFTYEKTTRYISRPDHFIQAMVLITIVAATIMQAIGDSVARGLGMLGALSIIRFRTTIRNPRNIVFMFSALAAGIACGVFGFVVAFMGTVSFCITAFLLRFSPFSRSKNLSGKLILELPMEYDNFPDLEEILNTYCNKYSLSQYKVFTNIKKANVLQYEYHLQLKNTYEGGQLVNELKKLTDIKIVSMNFINNVLELV